MRVKRHRLACIETDYKELMKRIEVLVSDLHAATKNLRPVQQGLSPKQAPKKHLPPPPPKTATPVAATQTPPATTVSSERWWA